jgi:hypothetical protein
MVSPSPSRQMPGQNLKEGHDLFLPSPYKPISIHNHFASFLKWCVISVMGIGLLQYLRKHITCSIMYNNKNNNFVS